MNISAVDPERRTFDSVPASAQAARRYVGEVLRPRGASETIIRDFQLVVSELVANVIEHGDRSRLTVFCDFTDPQWWDIGVVGGKELAKHPMTPSETWTITGNEHTSGRGLGIVRQLMDEIITDMSNGQVSVRCRRRRIEG